MFRFFTPAQIGIAVGLLMGLSGCAALSDTQRKTVANYAKLTQTYTQYPSAAAKTYATLYYDIDGLRFATDVGKGSDTVVNDQMWKAHSFRDSLLDEAGRLDKAVTAIRKYAQALEALSSADLPDAVGQNAGLVGSNLDAVVKQYNTTYKPGKPLPVGFGKLAGEAITLAGKRYVSHRQAVALREYMSKGDTLLRFVADDTRQAFTKSHVDWIRTLKTNLREQHTMMAGRLIKTDANHTYYAYQLDKDMVALIERISVFDDSMGLIQLSIMTLSDAHHSVLEDIRRKRSLKQQVADLQGLYSAVVDLNENYHKLTNRTSNQP